MAKITSLEQISAICDVLRNKVPSIIDEIGIIITLEKDSYINVAKQINYSHNFQRLPNIDEFTIKMSSGTEVLIRLKK